jgi:hypothetical protein
MKLFKTQRDVSKKEAVVHIVKIRDKKKSRQTSLIKRDWSLSIRVPIEISSSVKVSDDISANPGMNAERRLVLLSSGSLPDQF